MKRRFLEYGRDRLIDADADADHLDVTRNCGSRDRGDQLDAPGVYVRRAFPHSAQPRRRAGANR